jgi:pyruvate dehydrogenase E1 component
MVDELEADETTWLDELRAACGLRRDNEWGRFPEYSPPGRWCAARGRLLARPERSPGRNLAGGGSRSRPTVVPQRIDPRWPARSSTSEAFLHLLGLLERVPAIASCLVTTGRDLACAEARPVASATNLFLLLGQLGLAWDLSDQRLLAIGMAEETELWRGFDALAGACREGAGFVVALRSGAPAAPGVTASLALELPGLAFVEPCFHGELDWLLADALAAIAGGHPDAATCLRLSDRLVDQSPFEAARRRLGEERLRGLVLAGAYVLHDASALAAGGAPAVELVASGAVLPEVLEAAAELADEGVAADVLAVTSLSRCYRSWRAAYEGPSRGADAATAGGHLARLARRGVPAVTVHDSSSHAMAWVGSALGVPAISLGTDRFVPAGSLEDRYGSQGLLPGQIVNAALLALDAGN